MTLDAIHVRNARGPIRWFLRATGYCALTAPWRIIYVLAGHERDIGLIAHEAIHIEQIDRMGGWRFAVTYLWQLARHGYERHPMEIEARERSGCR